MTTTIKQIKHSDIFKTMLADLNIVLSTSYDYDNNTPLLNTIPPYADNYGDGESVDCEKVKAMFYDGFNYGVGKDDLDRHLAIFRCDVTKIWLDSKKESYRILIFVYERSTREETKDSHRYRISSSGGNCGNLTQEPVLVLGWGLKVIQHLLEGSVISIFRNKTLIHDSVVGPFFSDPMFEKERVGFDISEYIYGLYITFTPSVLLSKKRTVSNVDFTNDEIPSSKRPKHSKLKELISNFNNSQFYKIVELDKDCTNCAKNKATHYFTHHVSGNLFEEKRLCPECTIGLINDKQNPIMLTDTKID